jgi:hypothetical protein
MPLERRSVSHSLRSPTVYTVQCSDRSHEAADSHHLTRDSHSMMRDSRHMMSGRSQNTQVFLGPGSILSCHSRGCKPWGPRFKSWIGQYLRIINLNWGN